MILAALSFIVAKLATIGPVFGGGSIHSSARYRVILTLAWITLTALLLLWQGASLVVSSAETDYWRVTSIGNRPLAPRRPAFTHTVRAKRHHSSPSRGLGQTRIQTLVN